jgi:oxygen-independent coproporphyrinogen-3 oxidase
MSVAGPEHLYVHVPFCDGKCDYCGFYSIQADDAARLAFTPAPGRELALWAAEAGWPAGACAPRTVYFGGGTPGILGVDGMAALIDGLRHTVNLDSVDEWTVELSPTTAAPDLLARLRASGVNRISIGAQCFDDDVLRAMGRRHTAADVSQAVMAARSAGFVNVGLDLIAGLPEVDAGRWQLSLERALALAPEHLSIYALSIEPGSALQRRVASGLALPGADAQMDALAQAETVLADAGLLRYELSNYAREGRACRHNLACWRGGDFLGLGPSASSRVGCLRQTNSADVTAYGEALARGVRPPTISETRTVEDDVSERFVTGLRLSEGVAPRAFAARWPAAAARVAEWEMALARLERTGVVAPRAGHLGAWRLTPRGREVADAVMRELV